MEDPDENGRRAMTEARPRRWARRALALPLFWKILVANAAVVGVAAILGAVLCVRLTAAQASPVGAIAALTVAGIAMSLLLNAVILRLALEPVESLEQVAACVQAGDLDVRAPESPLADPALARLARTFNAALDALAASSRRVRDLLARSIEEDEEERRRVATALEGEAAQRLAGLLMRLRAAGRNGNGGEALATLVEEAREEIARAAEVVRSFARDRRSAVLDELGLVAALEAVARRIMEGSEMVVRVEGSIEGNSLPPEIARSLYRVAVEALENAVRHGDARTVRVQVEQDDGRISVAVEDDGRGFDPARANEDSGLGLLAMRERAENAGGRLDVWSEPGGGTHVRVEMPLPASGSVT